MNIAIIPAGGQGRRMNNAAPGAPIKQFLTLSGVPIIIHTLRQFEACAEIDAIMVALPAAEVASGNLVALCREHGLKKVLPPVTGAGERQDSIYCALQALAANPALHAETEFVAIHDAVRPLVTVEIISATIAAAKAHGAAICALAATDTIKEVVDHQIVATIPRSRIYLAQTPQSFRYPLILDAHRRAAAEQFAATDDAMLIEWLGLPVKVVEGSPDNIKITKPADLGLAELILARRQQRDRES